MSEDRIPGEDAETETPMEPRPKRGRPAKVAEADKEPAALPDQSEIDIDKITRPKLSAQGWVVPRVMTARRD